jgi:CcmD family protein
VRQDLPWRTYRSLDLPGQVLAHEKGFLMETFMMAYLAVWLAVVLYVGRLGVRQRHLQQTLDALQERMQHEADNSESPAKAA